MKVTFLPLLAFLIWSCDRNATPVEQNQSKLTLEAQIETVLSYNQLFGDSGPDRVEDFDLDGGHFYVHPTGAYGLFSYSMSDGKLTELIRYPSGNYMAQDSIFLFYEVSGARLFRWNLASDTTDMEFDLSTLEVINIHGLAAAGDSLFVLLQSANLGGRLLVVFSYDGQEIQRIPYDGVGRFLSVQHPILYSIYYPNSQDIALSRFNVQTENFLEPLTFPTMNGDGFRVVGEDLYFTDFEKAAILRVPLSALARE